MGPFKVLARPVPNTYYLKIPATWHACDEFNVERLRPYRRRPDGLVGTPGPPSLVLGADVRQEYEVQEPELLKFKMRSGQPYVLVRWADNDAARDNWEPLEAAGPPYQLRGGHCSIRAGLGRALCRAAASCNAATSCCCPLAYPPGRLYHRCCAAGRSPR